MKSHFSLAALLVAVTGSALSVSSQPSPPIVGGYSAASVKEPEVVKAAQFAVKTKAKNTRLKMALLSIQSAEKQAVAGMNYRVVLKVKAAAKPQRVKATVYKDLQGKYSLSEWIAVK